jgi:tetratricopeptide (TPR) repeat protein
LVKKNQLAEARPLVRDFVRFYADDVRGWTILARITDDKEEKVTALEKILTIKPDDSWAKQTWDKMLGEERIREAVAKAKVGQLGEAGELVDSILSDNPDNPGAWMLKARLTKNREEAIHALKEVLRINPKNKQAKDRLSRLTGGKVSAGKEKKEPKNKFLLFGIPAVLVLGILCVIFVLPLFGLDALPGGLGDVFSSGRDLTYANCQELVREALLVSNQNCTTLGSYEACYGNNNVQATLIPGAEGSFFETGHILNLEFLDEFITAPLDLEEKVWGVVIFKVPGDV